MVLGSYAVIRLIRPWWLNVRVLNKYTILELISEYNKLILHGEHIRLWWW